MQKARLRMVLRSRPAVLLGLVLAASLTSVFAAEQDEPRPPTRSVASGDGAGAPTIEPRADEILRAAGDYLKSAGAFSVHGEAQYDEVVMGGVKITYGASVDVSMRRPDRLYAVKTGDQVSRRMWYDGATMTVYSDSENVYSRVPVPSTIDAALDHVIDTYGVSAPLADLVYADPYAVLIEKVDYGFYVGLHEVQGVACHHLLFIQENVDWQIWIEDGDQFVPRKVVITYKNEHESPQYTAIISDWNFEPRISERRFVADPPDDAELIEILPLSQPEADQGE